MGQTATALRKPLKAAGAVCALAAFAALASLYAARELDLSADAQKAQIAQKWPGIVGMPVVAESGWRASSGSGALPPGWPEMQDSGRWAEAAFDAPGAGEDMTGTPWSGVRVGKVGEPVEIDVQGQVGKSPAATLHWTTNAIGFNPMTKRFDSHPVRHSELARAAGLSPASVSGELIQNEPVAGDVSGAQVRAQSVPLPLAPVPAGDFEPALARIQAPAIPGRAQVVWAYAQKAGLGEDGSPEVGIIAGYAPLSAVKAVIAEQQSQERKGLYEGGLIAFGVAASIVALFAQIAQRVMRSELRDGRGDVKMRLRARRSEMGSKKTDMEILREAGRARRRAAQP